MIRTEEDIKRLLNEVIDVIIDEGVSVVEAVKGKMARSEFYKFLDIYKDEFSDKYARACAVRAELLFEEMIQIADNTEDGKVIEESDTNGKKVTTSDMTQHRKLKIETRKWVIGKMNPKKYGDKNTTEITGKDGVPLIPITGIEIK